jgi:hypothetical protein
MVAEHEGTDVSEGQQWRKKLLPVGRLLVFLSAVAIAIVWARVSRLMHLRSFNEMAIYVFGGLLISLLAVVLLLLSKGRMRWLFIVLGIAEFIFWFSFPAIAARLFA